ncbi:MAG: protein-tyrosine-phosphatase [Cytophagales bacterium]|nr:protein-tyrosine-phosphatase [Cytophagales bacterium]
MKKTFNLLKWVFAIAFITASSLSNLAIAQSKLYKKLDKYCKKLPENFASIPDERKQKLTEIAEWIYQNKSQNKKTQAIVICTQNSRRSHMGQIWMKVASVYYGVTDFESFSGGTNASAFNERAIAALKRAGFVMSKMTNNEGNNVKWEASYGSQYPNNLMYSKKYNDQQNPQSDFGAIMVCSEADKSCPMVEGADARFSLPYDDPKHFDNTPQEAMKYDERCLQIATEMFFVFNITKNKLVEYAEKAKIQSK